MSDSTFDAQRTDPKPPDPQQPLRVELGHIGYLLDQFPGWRVEGLLPPQSAQILSQRYRTRQQQLFDTLLATAQAPRSAAPAVSFAAPPATAPPVAPGAPPRIDPAPAPDSVISKPPPAPAGDVTGPVSSPAFSPTNSLRQAANEQLQSRPQRAEEPPPFQNPTIKTQNHEPLPLRRLFQAHGLKVLFALATLFVLAALRSLLGAELFGRIVQQALPAIPLGLSALLAWFGSRTHAANPWAGFVYSGLACLLAGIGVMAVNANWLHHLMPLKWTLIAASGVASAAAGALVASRRETSYLHLFQTFAFLTLYALLQPLRLAVAPADLRPTPVLLFGIAYLLYGGLCLIAARFSKREIASEADSKADLQADTHSWSSAWTLWAHLGVAAAAAMALIATLTWPEVGHKDLALMAALAGLIYTAGAQMLRQPRMVPVAAAFLAAGILLWLPGHPADQIFAILCGFLLTYHLFTLGLAAYNDRVAQQAMGDRLSTALAQTYRLAASIALIVATPIAGLYALTFSLMSLQPSLGLYPPDLITGIVLLALCGLFHAGSAVQKQRAESAYAALICAAGASGLLFLPWIATTYRGPAEALAPFLLIASAIVWWESVSDRKALTTEDTEGHRGEKEGDKEEGKSAERKGEGDENTRVSRGQARLRPMAALWLRPMFPLALFALVALSLLEPAGRLISGVAGAMWGLWLLPTLASALLLAASRTGRGFDPARDVAVGALCVLGTLLTAAACGLPHGLALSEWPLAAVRALGLSLVALAWAWWGLAEVGRKRDTVWEGSLATGGLITGLLAGMMLFSAVLRGWQQNALLLDLGMAALFALFALDSLRRQRSETAYASVLVLLMAGGANLFVRIGVPWAVTAWSVFAVGSAAVYVLLSLKLREAGVARLAALPVLSACLLFLPHGAALRVFSPDTVLARLLLTVGGGALALAWLRVAGSLPSNRSNQWDDMFSEHRDFSYGAGLLLIGIWLCALSLFWLPPTAWLALLLLPLLAALYVLGTTATGASLLARIAGMPSDPAPLRTPDSASKIDTLCCEPLRITALAASAFALALSFLAGDGVTGAPPLVRLVTFTLAAYGVAYALLAWQRRSAGAILACAAALTLTQLHALAEPNALLTAFQHSFVSPIAWPRWILTLFAFACAALALALARRTQSHPLARAAFLPLLIGAIPFWVSWPIASADLVASRPIWTLGCLAVAWAWLRAAAWSKSSDFTYGAAALTGVSFLCALRLLWLPSPVWYGLLLLPLLAALYALGSTRIGASLLAVWTGSVADPTETEILFAEPFRSAALIGSVAALAWTFAQGDRFPDPQVLQVRAVTLTLAAYGLLYALWAWPRRAHGILMLAGVTLTAAYLHLLLEGTALFSPLSPSLSWPRWAFLGVQAGVVWLGLGWRLRLQGQASMARSLLLTAGGVSLLCGAIAFWNGLLPAEGFWSLIALAWCGAIWLSLWRLEQGELCLHLGAWSLIGLAALFLDRWVGYRPELLDLYLLPIGAYLLVLGHLAGRRPNDPASRPLWWAGMLLILTPAFAATFSPHGAGHGMLLLIECLLAVIWGIAHKIRAYVSTGMGYAILYASAVLVGYLQDKLSAVTALILGVGLFVVGFYALTHREALQRFAASLDRHWTAWRAWR